MGYLVSMAIIKGMVDPAPLHQLDSSIPWRSFSLPDSDLTLVEWLHQPISNDSPPNKAKFPALPEFACRPSGVSFPSDFGDRAPGLDQLYSSLLTQKRASTLPKVAVHLALRLSELTGCRVITIMSNDDGWDFGCEASAGRLDKVRFDSDDEFITLDAAGIVLREADSRECKQLHEVATSFATSWDARLVELFGFDGDPESLGLVEIAQTSEVAAPSHSPSETKDKPFWKFW